MRDGTITIDTLDNHELPFSVDFWGWNEGSGTPCKNKEEVDEQVKFLINKHKDKYKIKIVDNRIKQTTL